MVRLAAFATLRIVWLNGARSLSPSPDIPGVKHQRVAKMVPPAALGGAPDQLPTRSDPPARPETPTLGKGWDGVMQARRGIHCPVLLGRHPQVDVVRRTRQPVTLTHGLRAPPRGIRRRQALDRTRRSSHRGTDDPSRPARHSSPASNDSIPEPIGKPQGRSPRTRAHLADYGPDAGSTVAQAPKSGLDLPDDARCDPG